MLWIKKGSEPDSLTQHKKKRYASYDNCNKEDIREALLKEQGYLCAYCMRKIPTEKGMKIEHWYPEAKLDESGRMDYENMLGCCMGHEEGGKHRDDTCDTHKGDEMLTVDPRKKEHITKICYKEGTGEIYSKDLVINTDLNKTLNLNCSYQLLKENRKAVLNKVKDKLKHDSKGKGRLSKREWMKILREYSEADANGQKKEYAGIVIWYIEKRIKRIS